MQVQFVGCGDAFDSGGRQNTCFHVTGNSVNCLIDCRASVLTHLDEIRPKRLMLTHMSDDLLSRLAGLDHAAAQNGLIVEI